MTKKQNNRCKYPKGINRFEYHGIEVTPLPKIESSEIPKNKSRRRRKRKVRRNNGFGKSARHAMTQAIKHHYHEVHPLSWKDYTEKSNYLSDWLKLKGINDIMTVTQEILNEYFEDLKCLIKIAGFSASYAKSLGNASNVVIYCVHKNKYVSVSPSSLAKYSAVRKTIPFACDDEKMELAINELFMKGKYVSALRIQSIVYAGLRRKETTMIDAMRMLDECHESQATTGVMQCRIIEGAKGGLGRDNVKTLRDKKGRLRKRFNRVINVDQELYELIKLLADEQGNSKCLIPDELEPDQFYNKIYNDWRPVAKKYGLGSLHDIRSAYACRRYFEITGYPAPVITGCVLATWEEDEAAREIISREMGHNRPDVLVSYIGGKRSLHPVHTRKVYNHNQAFRQSFNFLSFRISTDDLENIKIAERASNVIRNIFLDSKVGIFNIEYSDIHAYINKWCRHLKGKDLQELKITLSFFINKLYEKEWLELLENDLNNITIE